MMQNVSKLIKRAYDKYDQEQEDFSRSGWVMGDHIAQAICVVGSLMWTWTTEQIFAGGVDIQDNLEWWLSENKKELKELTKIVSRRDLDDRKRKAVVALITQDVHYRDIIDDLVSN